MENAAEYVEHGRKKLRQAAEYKKRRRVSVAEVYRWFSWGMASLLEGKSQGPCSAQLCEKYGLVKCFVQSV